MGGHDATSMSACPSCPSGHHHYRHVLIMVMDMHGILSCAPFDDDDDDGDVDHPTHHHHLLMMIG